MNYEHAASRSVCSVKRTLSSGFHHCTFTLQAVVKRGFYEHVLHRRRVWPRTSPGRYFRRRCLWIPAGVKRPWLSASFLCFVFFLVFFSYFLIFFRRTDLYFIDSDECRSTRVFGRCITTRRISTSHTSADRGDGWTRRMKTSRRCKSAHFDGGRGVA